MQHGTSAATAESMPKVLFCLQEMCRKQAGKTSAAAEANLDSDADKDIPSAKSPRQSLSKHTSSSDDENDETRSRQPNRAHY